MNKRKQRGFSLIELLIVVAIIGIIAAIAIPNLLQSQKAARETAALQEVRNIGGAQLQYSLTKGRSKFADSLATLGANSMVDSNMASGTKGGYIFTSGMVSEGPPALFDTTAKPVSVGTFGTGDRSFYSNESNVIYEVEGGEPPTAEIQDRVPKNGNPVTQ